MKLSRSEVVHVANLARLDLSEVEVELFTEQLGMILEHATDIGALDLDGVEPTARPVPQENVMRQDEVRPGLDRRDVLSSAPAVESNRFLVPRIIGEEP
ncbi:MAG: Asp-tRNA(Asn)/Glu-tRNA(Gln) amidotransferase subunit GatC [Actinobacteria bacterium]|nr:Asp-tRNA(Asn)/Glu-tRNA(Gln) amidotransferase subunit GatC [Actinomycetota bacterium]MCL5445192.1 Asp-tRNA(Asn)/Glu-tRNA(Gln) amidotransferase subunit GatC [Actinomycetota bacterium]